MKFANEFIEENELSELAFKSADFSTALVFKIH